MNHKVKESFYAPINHPGWTIALGIGLIVLGFFALRYAVATTIFSVLYLGAFFLIGGVLELIRSFDTKTWRNFFLHLFIGILFSAAGVLMIKGPAMNAVTLTMFLAIVFMVTGGARILYALIERIPNWGWLLLSGIISLILGILIWYQWPVSGMWIIGAFIGIDLLFAGFSMLFTGIYGSRIQKSFEQEHSN